MNGGDKLSTKKILRLLKRSNMTESGRQGGEERSPPNPKNGGQKNPPRASNYSETTTKGVQTHIVKGKNAHRDIKARN